MAIAFQTKSDPVVGGAGDTIVIDKPTGTAEGDLMIAQIALGVPGRSITPPGGWTLVDEADQGTVDCHIFRKEAGASEGSTYTFSLSNDSKYVAFISRFSGNFPTNPVDVYDGNTGQSSSPTAPTITPTETPTMLYAGFGADDDDATQDTGYPSGYTGIYIRQMTGSGAVTGGAAYKSYSGTSATGTAAFSINASEGWGAIQLALYEEAGGTTHEVSTTIAHAHAMSSANVMTTDQLVAFALSQALSSSALMQTGQSVSLPITVTAGATGNAIYQGSISFDVDGAIIFTAESEGAIDADATFAMNQTMGASVLADFQENVTLDQVLQLSAQSIATLNNEITIDLSTGLATIGGTVLETSAILSFVSSLGAAGTVIQQGLITTPDGRTLKVSFDDRTLKISFDDRDLNIPFDDRDLKIH